MKTKEEKLVTQKALRSVRTCDTSEVWQREKREAAMNGKEREFVLQQWALQMKTDPPEGVSWIMLEVKLAYHIEYEEKKARGQEMSPKFLKNYKAAMDLNLEGFHPDMKYLLELSLKYKGVSPEKEQEMKVKRKASAAKAQATKAKKEVNKGPKKGATWVGLFQANFSKKLTDAELAKAMTKAMGDGHTYTEQEVVKNRGFFNFGAFGAKFDKPKTPLMQFKDGKEVAAKAKKAKAKK